MQTVLDYGPEYTLDESDQFSAELAHYASCLIMYLEADTAESAEFENAALEAIVVDTAARSNVYELFWLTRNGTVQQVIHPTYAECTDFEVQP